MHILVVDDDDDIRRVFSAAFVAAGHQITAAVDGAQALELIEQHQRLEHHKFDAVLLDVEMPTLSGWKVLEAIRNMPGHGAVPVILFTAHGNISSDAYAKMLGAYALLRKPVAAQRILELIHQAIAERDCDRPDCNS